MDVKPWEPVRGGYFTKNQWPVFALSRDSFYGFHPSAKTPLYLTLANGQRIIVRALSDERKAARSAMKEAVS